MKVRKGFVANSSSSSYVCDVCGRAEGGWDMSLSEAEMLECENGHTFCESEAIGDHRILSKETAIELARKKLGYSWISDEDKKEIKEEIDQMIAVAPEDWDEYFSENDIAYFLDYDEHYDLPSCFCPICTLNEVTKDMKIKYLMKKSGLTEEELRKEIKDNFLDYKEFSDYIY